MHSAGEEHDAGQDHAAECKDKAGHGGISARAQGNDEGKGEKAETGPEHPRLHPELGGGLHHRAAGRPQTGHDEQYGDQREAGRAEGRAPEVLAGVPETDMRFFVPGKYRCSVETGIVVKGSCAGVTYDRLSTHSFDIEVKE